MQITNADVIKTGEQDLIDSITADLDWGAIENIFREQHNLGIDENVEYRQGDIIVHHNQIAYQLQFEVKVTVSVLLDREGNYLSVSISEKNENEQGEPDESVITERNNSTADEEENIRESSEKKNTPPALEKEGGPIKEDIEELETLSKDEEFDDSEIIDTEDIEGEIEEDAESKKIDEPLQTNHNKIVEEGFNENSEDSGEKISRITSRVGEIMDELEEETSVQK